MRRSFIVAVLLAVVCAVSLSGRSARAQLTAHSLTPAQQVVSQYLLTPSQTPAGLREAGVNPLDNVLVAALAENPTDVQKVVDRARLDGLEQDFNQTSGSAAQIEVQVSLYRDNAGASTDVADPTLLAGLPLTAASAPSFGDASAAFGTKGGTVESTSIVFSEGRLEVLVGEVGPPGSTNQADIMPVARLMETRARAAPPAPTPEELAVLQTETTPESILYDAYELLLQNYLSQLQPSQLLTAAYNGASKALSDAGVSDVPPAPSISSSDQDEAWSQFLPAYQSLESLAPSSISASNLAHGAATALYNNLNCHTTFFTPTMYAREMAELKGSAEARIGILLQKYPDGSYAILRVEPGSPAEQAGLKAGDVIQAVDHKTAADEGTHFTDLFVGPAGSPIMLTVQRTGVEQPFDLTIVRQLIKSVIEQHRILPGGIGYVELDAFTDGSISYDNMAQALKDFDSAGNVNSWILDLRYNGGGSEQTLDRVAGLFVPAGSILVTETTQDGTISTSKSIGTPVPDQKSMVVLVGGDTASAAEIFAQSLKDLGRATIVGAKTAGCVNGGLPLGLLDGSGIFVSTIAVGAGPNKVTLENAGIAPDLPVTQSLSDLQQGTDPVLSAAVALFGGPTPAAQPSAPSSSMQAPDFINPSGVLWK